MQDLRQQRRHALAARRRMSNTQRARASLQACRRLGRLAPVRRARHVGIYAPLRSEISPLALRRLANRHTIFYFPRVTGSQLLFVAHGHNRWQYSDLGVWEPTGHGHGLMQLDVLIMPLAGFDCRANRIGLGGGFYDRTLADCHQYAYRGPKLIGLAFECQRLKQIRPNPWDIAPDIIVSEKCVYYRRPNSQRVSRSRATNDHETNLGA